MRPRSSYWQSTKADGSTELTKNLVSADGQTVLANAPRFLAREALFDPGLIKEGDENGGIAVLCYNLGASESC